jgi:tetratricopeptide (TPR) repeat protein
MYDRLQDLQRQRRELVGEFEAARQRTTHGTPSEPVGGNEHRDITQFKQELDRRKSQVTDRGRRIQDKVERLRRLVEQAGACQPPPGAAPTAAASSPSATTRPSSANDQPPDEPTPAVDLPSEAVDAGKTAAVDAPPVTTPTATFPVNTDNASPDASQSGDAPAAKQSSEAIVQAVAMVDGPVDQLGFANNLYATGEFQLALEIYQKIDRSNAGERDWLWIEYQIANCQRRLGKMAEAERGFRIVTSRDKNTWMGQNARWWLDVSDRTQKLQDRILNAQQLLEQLELQEDSNATGSPNSP